ncbi:MAG: class I SAM-dependent methyltransferase [Planctomycetota bacterium]|nr:MAG: class I SAM-dependent methyltransferase [Planctomycetota bacterium]
MRGVDFVINYRGITYVEQSIEIKLEPTAGHFKEAAIALYAGDSVLDVGGREGKYAKHALSLGKSATLCDIEPKCAEEGGLKVVTGDALDLPFPDKSFDTVLCLDVLEHVEDDAAALVEACRVARRNVLISVPRADGHTTSASGLAFRHYRDESHRRYYTEKSFRKLLEGAPGIDFGMCAFSRVRPARYYTDAGGPKILARLADAMLWLFTWRKENLLRNFFGVVRVAAGDKS